ncbi:MAG TPA: hypothetical protein VFK45_08855 [Gammaproteobacteria bacterium]|nr:hypothetical protein [Gammaproteobacteria bacterium]
MKSWNPLFFIGLMLMFVGVGLTIFTDGVRNVDAVGLFGTGMGCGAALAGAIMTFRMVRPGRAGTGQA